MMTGHGDFGVDQFLDGPHGPTLIDFDDICTASPAWDLANYATHVRTDTGDRMLAVLAGVVEGYGRVPEALPWYLATARLLRAHQPFRHLDEGWPDRVEALVAEAEALLG
jgi:thiamine kinase-like enzyme